MDFTLSGEQRQFAASLHDMLAAADGPAATRAWAAGNREPGLKIWRALAEAGVTALAVPASSGGLAADPVDLVIACEEVGHHAIPGPAAETLGAIPALLAALLQPPVAPAALATDLSSTRVAAEADQDRFVEPESPNP